MYLYFYDSFLVEAKYRKLIDKIETRLTDLGISGKLVRLTILKNAQEIIQDNLKKGIKTVVAIGSDSLLRQSAIALAGTDAVLGFIPVGQSILAQILGIPNNEYACDVVSARLIQKIDLGKINNQYFLSSVIIPKQKAELRCDDSYQIKSVSAQGIKIINLDLRSFDSNKNITELKASKPDDGFLEILVGGKTRITLPFFKKVKENDSLFYVKKVEISSPKDKEIDLVVDQEKILKTPATVTVIPNHLKIIVGRDRMI